MKYCLTSSMIILFVYCSQIGFSQSLIAYYPFDDNAKDRSGRENHGKIIGGVTSATDRFGNPCGALSFNGINGYIEVMNSASLQSPNSSLSVACWFKIRNSPTTPDNWLSLICKGIESQETLSNPQYRFQVLQTNDQSTISISSDFTEFDEQFRSHTFQMEEWNFFAMVYDGNFVRVYLNQNKIWEFPYRKSFDSNDSPLQIAKDVPGVIEYFCGDLDDLRIYSSALTQAEIYQLFNNRTGAMFEGPFTLICPQNIIINTNEGKCSALTNYDEPAVDIVCGSVDLEIMRGLPSGSQFPLGINTVAFIAESNFGQKQACDFTVSILDAQPPVFNCPSDTVIFIKDINYRHEKYVYQMPSASDNCSIAKIELVEGLQSGSDFLLGTTTLKFRALDRAGNYSECSYTIIIKEPVDHVSEKEPVDLAEKETIDIVEEEPVDVAEKETIDIVEEEPVDLAEKEPVEINYEHDLTFADCIITAVMYDDGQEDHDTVSIYFNNMLIVDRQMIRRKKNKTINKVLVLKQNEKNYLVSKAWNTGELSPNTLKIEFYEGDLSRKLKKSKRASPTFVKNLHSEPGLSGAIILRCDK